MAIVRRKPRNASLRFQTFISSDDVTKKAPEKRLSKGMKKSAGRNARGCITVRHRGGGTTRKYRWIDFYRQHKDVTGVIKAIEYDPNRNVRIGLVAYANGARTYVLLPENVTVGSSIIAGENVEVRTGNSLPLASIPIGFIVHNVEIKPGRGGVFARSAGTSVQLIAKDEQLATLRMPSGEMRQVPVGCWATIGSLGNADAKNVSLGKAGRTRHRGFRPTVRGMCMNPIDHPHGGGEGRSKSGSHPVSPWGKGAKGTRTRKKKNPLILKRRRK